ncbi:MAG: hypothetical protein ACFFD2_03370 [Promethearchaeota archaeon]
MQLHQFRPRAGATLLPCFLNYHCLKADGFLIPRHCPQRGASMISRGVTSRGSHGRLVRIDVFAIIGSLTTNKPIMKPKKKLERTFIK